MSKKILMLLVVLSLATTPLFSLVPGFGGSHDLGVFMSSRENNSFLINNLKLWFGLEFNEELSLYLRGKLQYAFELAPNESSSGIDDWATVIDLDQGFFAWKTDTLELTLGRALETLGSGILFNGTADGVSFRVSLSDLELGLFAVYTGLLAKDANPYNFSRQDINDGAKRFFGGLSASLDLATGLNATLSGLLQLDNGESGDQRYDTTHLSLALEAVFSPGITAQMEGIFQAGESPDGLGGDPHSIRAWAAALKLRFGLLDESESAFIIDAAYSSGSDQRSDVSPTGMQGDGYDKQFLSFGTYSTGFAYEPELSNLIFASLTFITLPFSDTSIFGRSSLAIRSAVYFKSEKAGPVSLSDALGSGLNPDESFLGYAFDVNYAWRLLSDLSFILAAGVFKPGPAFVERDLELLVQTGLIFSF